MKYILITPVKNEGENLPRLAECIINQTTLPQIWLILNDNSTDNTQLIIAELENSVPWIKGKKHKESIVRDLDKHFGKICNLAFQEAIRYCKKRQLPIDYLVKVDADTVISKSCIEEILIKLDKDKKIGIASPHVKDWSNNLFCREKLDLQNPADYISLESEPSDGLRIYRNVTFEDIGGIPETMAPDVVALAKAELKGWKVKRFKELICYSTRKTSSSIGSIQAGYVLQGLRRYYLNYPFSLVVFFAILKMFEGRPDLGMALLIGFINGVIHKNEKISDKELKDYYRKKRPKKIIGAILGNVV